MEEMRLNLPDEDDTGRMTAAAREIALLALARGREIAGDKLDVDVTTNMILVIALGHDAYRMNNRPSSDGLAALVESICNTMIATVSKLQHEEPEEGADHA